MASNESTANSKALPQEEVEAKRLRMLWKLSQDSFDTMARAQAMMGKREEENQESREPAQKVIGSKLPSGVVALMESKDLTQEEALAEWRRILTKLAKDMNDTLTRVEARRATQEEERACTE